MPEKQPRRITSNPFDLTKVLAAQGLPAHRSRELVLDRNPENYFAEVEQAAFEPRNIVPGMGLFARQNAPGALDFLSRRTPLPPRREL